VLRALQAVPGVRHVEVDFEHTPGGVAAAPCDTPAWLGAISKSDASGRYRGTIKELNP
jgi:hypothetical protein